MAAARRQKTTDIIQALAEKPYGFDFFRAVRLLETRFPDWPHLGNSLTPRQDPIRFKQRPSLAFAPSTLDGFASAGNDRPPSLFVNFLGLFGPNGPMPLHLTEYAHDRQRNAHDGSLVGFCDIFHQRLLSLFYRAWAVNQKSVDMDRPRESRFAIYIGSLFGIGTESLLDRDAVPDWAKLYYSGRLVSQARNADGLEAIIADYFGLPTAIEPFSGQWVTLPENSICRLGASPETGSLGVTTIVGARIWDCQLKFRIRLGPMTLSDVYRLLPTGESFRRLKTWVLNYVNQELYWDAQLVVKREEVPGTCLGQAGLLGWTAWIRSKPFEHDADDLVINGSN
jgi:type VI secretion system protein ImpH